MEHDELDEMFKKVIQNDESPLNQKEMEAKERIWDALKPRKKVIPFPIWKVASAILFLLLAGSASFFSSKVYQQNQNYLVLESKYNDLNSSVANLRAELNVEKELKEEFTFSKQNEGESQFENPIPKTVNSKIIYLKDTVWMTKNIIDERNEIIIRDTVFIEVPAPKPPIFVKNKMESKAEPDTLKKKKKPSKVKFVFDKNKIKKVTPRYKYLRINESEIVRKNDSSKSGIITIPIKN